MFTFQLRKTDEFIKLGQLLKAVGFVETGVDAKDAICEGLVKVNGEVELRRGRKLRDQDVVTFQDKEIQVMR